MKTIADVIAEWRDTFSKWQTISDESAKDLESRINYYISTQLSDTVVVNKGPAFTVKQSFVPAFPEKESQ